MNGDVDGTCIECFHCHARFRSVRYPKVQVFVEMFRIN